MKSLASHVATALAALAVAVLWLGNQGSPAREADLGAPGPAAAPAPTPPPPPPPIPDDLARLADADEQVNIRVYQAANRGVVNITTAALRMGLFSDDVARGSGSGFFIDREGHILTNYHVIADAEEITVTLHDGSTHRAELVGVDPNNDAAIVRVDVPSDAILPLPLGDSAGLLVGQKVLALGNPFGLERTLTTGIVSSLDRSMKAKNGRTIKGIVQTDAAINPGNSGGPLLNSKGQVIGVTTAIISQVGQSAGIGFAVPINAIKRILTPLIEHGRVIRADLGLARVFTTERGIYIIDLVEGGPAERAGLRPIQVVVERFGQFVRTRPDPESADRIVTIDGKPVRSVDELLSEVEAHQPGEVVNVGVVRRGRRREVEVELGATD